jgi:hypothetical protein
MCLGKVLLVALYFICVTFFRCFPQANRAVLEKARKQLDEKEHTLECTRVVLQQTVQEKELQRHLVEKHMETETKLGQQARKLLVVCDDTNR